jgi:threonine/homoserine/homoserine lactone efflux protein
VTVELWLAFVAASAVVLAVPGPTVLLVTSYVFSEGRRSARATVPGVALGDCVAMTASLAGLGAAVAASATAFTVLKWAGAAYLVWLGATMWRAKPQPPAVAGAALPALRDRAMFAHAFAVTALNPKSIAFFVAFLPQFVAPGAPVPPQLAILGATFLVLATANAAAYAALAGTARRGLSRPGVVRAVNRLGGTLLIGAGVMTATLRRAGS